MLEKIISGGQTGADQAGLLAAHKCGLLTGGTAPSGFYTDWGPNPLLQAFGLKAEGNYRSRTIKNVKDSDGTVLLTITPNSAGSVLTRNEATRQNKPFLEIDLNPLMQILQNGEAIPGGLGVTIRQASMDLQFWLVDNLVATLNVAGNREKHKNLLTTRAVEMILMDAFRTLDVSGLLIRANDF